MKSSVIILLSAVVLGGVIIASTSFQNYVETLENRNKIESERLAVEKKRLLLEENNAKTPTVTPTPTPIKQTNSVIKPAPTPKVEYIPIEIGGIKHECVASSQDYLNDLNKQWKYESTESAQCEISLIKSRSDYDSEDYENMLDDCDDEADSVVRKIRDAEKKYCTFCGFCD